MAAPRADLAVTSLSDPTTAALVGTSFYTSDVTQNLGAAAAAASTTRFYLSLEQMRDAADVLLSGSRPIPALTPGASSAALTLVTVPLGSAPGAYFLIACADDLAQLDESSETNNCRAATGRTIQISAP